MRVILCLLFVLAIAACEAEPGYLFPGWARIPATAAAVYCEERGAVLVEVPTTDADIAEARDACLLADETGPCWVGEPVDGIATVITIDGYVLEFPEDIGPALALCRLP